MPRDLIACPVPDLSSFAKSLRAQLSAQLGSDQSLPSHLSLLNMLARAAGHRNLQALKAAATRPSPAPALPLPPARGPRHPALSDAADRALRQFDAQGRLMRWPTKYTVQRYAMWGLWLHFDAKRPYTEREVNAVLQQRHSFGDHCTLRRELITMRLLERTPDGTEYRKVAARPEADVAALLHELRARSAL